MQFQIPTELQIENKCETDLKLEKLLISGEISIIDIDDQEVRHRLNATIHQEMFRVLRVESILMKKKVSCENLIKLASNFNFAVQQCNKAWKELQHICIFGLNIELQKCNSLAAELVTDNAVLANALNSNTSCVLTMVNGTSTHTITATFMIGSQKVKMSFQTKLVFVFGASCAFLSSSILFVMMCLIKTQPKPTEV